MFANGTMGGSGYNFDISFFNESEIDQTTDDPCESSYGHLLICVDIDFDESSARIDNGIIVTDKWILTSATTCFNIYNNPWNDYFIQAGKTNLTESETGSAIKDYHIYSKDNENQDRGCNQHDDYCLIELETPLVISEAVQAIGFQDLSGSTTPTTTTTEWTTLTWDSTWHPGLTTTLSSTTTTTTITTTTSTTMDGRKKRQANTNPTPPIPIMPTTLPWWATTTTPSYPSRCWISAWSDKNLRTFKADVDSECYVYYSDSHISFRKNKLSIEEQANLQKKIESYRKTSNAQREKNDKSNDDFLDEIIYQIKDAMEERAEKEAIDRSYYRRSHFCIDNLRIVSIVLKRIHLRHLRRPGDS